MSVVFAAAELASLRATQESVMQDTCQVGVRTAAVDAYGENVETFTYGAAIFCGLDFKFSQIRRDEWRSGDGTIVRVDSAARLPHGTAVNSRDRIKVTKRFSETLAVALVYEVAGEPVEGPSGIEVGLVVVET